MTYLVAVVSFVAGFVWARRRPVRAHVDQLVTYHRAPRSHVRTIPPVYDWENAK